MGLPVPRPGSVLVKSDEPEGGEGGSAPVSPVLGSDQEPGQGARPRGGSGVGQGDHHPRPPLLPCPDLGRRRWSPPAPSPLLLLSTRGGTGDTKGTHDLPPAWRSQRVSTVPSRQRGPHPGAQQEPAGRAGLPVPRRGTEPGRASSAGWLAGCPLLPRPRGHHQPPPRCGPAAASPGGALLPRTTALRKKNKRTYQLTPLYQQSRNRDPALPRTGGRKAGREGRRH